MDLLEELVDTQVDTASAMYGTYARTRVMNVNVSFLTQRYANKSGFLAVFQPS